MTLNDFHRRPVELDMVTLVFSVIFHVFKFVCQEQCRLINSKETNELSVFANIIHYTACIKEYSYNSEHEMTHAPREHRKRHTVPM